jgi:hypothetical protein
MFPRTPKELDLHVRDGTANLTFETAINARSGCGTCWKVHCRNDRVIAAYPGVSANDITLLAPGACSSALPGFAGSPNDLAHEIVPPVKRLRGHATSPARRTRHAHQSSGFLTCSH